MFCNRISVYQEFEALDANARFGTALDCPHSPGPLSAWLYSVYHSDTSVPCHGTHMQAPRHKEMANIVAVILPVSLPC